MSLVLTSNPGSFAHVNNPMVFVYTATGESWVTVSIAGLFSGKYTPDASNKVTVDLADILRSKAVSMDLDAGILPIISQYGSNPEAYTVTATGSTGASHIFNGKVVMGGVSKALLRQLIGKGLTMFTYRLNNFNRQFLFTTRTNGRIIRIKETELTPLQFLHPGVAISFVSDRGRLVVTTAATAGMMCTLNIEALRKQIWTAYGETCNYFSVLIGGQHIFAIAITEAAASSERYLLHFRNSLGSYERIEAIGKAIQEPAFSDAESYLVFDPAVYDYVTTTDRRLSTDTLKMSVGYKSNEELAFIADLLSSDDVYLIRDGVKQKVTVIPDTYNRALVQTEPGTVQLTVSIAETDRNYSPDLDLSEVDVQTGEWFLEDNVINNFGFVYSNSIIP
jgi:hypothetical protein